MIRVRRPSSLVFLVEDAETLDIALLLRGTVSRTVRPRFLVASPLFGTETEISWADLDTLLRVPVGAWTSVDRLQSEGVNLSAIDGLVDRGLLLSNASSERARRLRARDEQLAASAWNRYAALYHFMGKWDDYRPSIEIEHSPVSIQEAAPDSNAGYQKHAEQHGLPPCHFYERGDASRVLELTVPEADTRLSELLRARETTRLFERDAVMSFDDLSVLLYEVFGCHGIARLSPDVVVMKRTSPSAGALHPIEVYPLIRRVDAVEVGLYHYNVRTHSLEMLEALDNTEVEELANELLAGQHYFATAQVLLLITARFYRHFWKYRRHRKAYRAILLEIGHFSQSLYLTCTELGLGAFVTAAINEGNVERALRVDGLSEGALAICGCGPCGDKRGLNLEVEPYQPARP